MPALCRASSRLGRSRVASAVRDESSQTTTRSFARVARTSITSASTPNHADLPAANDSPAARSRSDEYGDVSVDAGAASWMSSNWRASALAASRAPASELRITPADGAYRIASSSGAAGDVWTAVECGAPLELVSRCMQEDCLPQSP